MRYFQHNGNLGKILESNIHLKTNKFVNQKVVLHKHTFFEINIGIKGFFINNVNDNEYDFFEGRCAILRPDVDYHFFSFPDNKEQYYIHRDIYVDKETMISCCNFISDSLYNEIMTEKEPIVFTLSKSAIAYIDEKCNTISNNLFISNNNLKHIFDTVVLDILSAYNGLGLIHNDLTLPKWIKDLYLRTDRLDFLTKSEAEIAEFYGYSTAYFSRAFKKITGQTYNQYVSIKKIQLSLTMLLDPDKSILDIAQDLGFSCPSPFNKLFKKTMKCSPSQYKKLIESGSIPF